MLNKETRRRIARKFIEKNFGKYPLMVTRNFSCPDYSRPFELWAEPDEVSFQVIHAPYVHGPHKTVIAVSDNEKELHESVKKNFDKNNIAAGCVEYENFENYFIAYD